MADKTVSIILSAVDDTRKGIASASSGLASLAKQAAGTALGFGLYNGVGSIFGGITDVVLGMNNSLDATQRQGVTMLDSIRNAAIPTGEAIQATAKQTQDWGRQLREIREREATGLEDFARKTQDLNTQIAELLSGKDLQKLAANQKQTLDDMATDHQDRVAQLQENLAEEQKKGIYVDGILYQQGNAQRIAAIQEQIDQENHEYDKKVARRKRDDQQALDDMKATDNQRLADLRQSLEDEKATELKFTRDIKEAYADLEAAKRVALTGGGGGGFAQGTQAVITYREELKKLKSSSKEVFDQFNKFFVEEGVRSPFNVADIQAAGSQLVQYSGGNLANMEKIIRMAEALASSPAVQQFSSEERLNLGIRALSEAYNGQFTSLQRIFNISSNTFDSLQKGTFTTTDFTNKLNTSLESSGVNYELVNQYSQTLEGSWGNLVETGKLLLANISSPIYAAFRDELVRINTWVTSNQGAINAWADDMKNRLGKFLQENVLPHLHDIEHWFKDYLTSGQWKKDIDGIATGFQNIANAGKAISDSLKGVGDAWKGVTGAVGTVTSAPVNAANWLYDNLFNLNKKAAGGPVSAGTPYIVGERGQELFVPNQSGTIIPADQTRQMLSGGSGPIVHIENFHAHNDIDVDAFAQKLSWRLS